MDQFADEGHGLGKAAVAVRTEAGRQIGLESLSLISDYPGREERGRPGRAGPDP
jgi:hypothetical protein